MSAPRKIWAWTSPRQEQPRHFWTTGIVDGPTELYHHDDVVRELADLLLEAEQAMPSDLRTYRGLRGRISAALAKIAQEDANHTPRQAD